MARVTLTGSRRLSVPFVVRRHSAGATLVAGFLFDFFTMQRIDAWTDLAFQLGYLIGLRRVTAETEDGRAIAILSFRVQQDRGTGERRWKTLPA